MMARYDHGGGCPCGLYKECEPGCEHYPGKDTELPRGEFKSTRQSRTQEYYECHITMEGDKAFIEAQVKAIGWTFSAIDKDIILGDGVKCYATHHYNSVKYTKEEVISKVTHYAHQLRGNGCRVIREKVELVIHDVRPK
jgi:hypothetical protein